MTEDRPVNDWEKHASLVLFRLEQNEKKTEQVRQETTEQLKMIDHKLDDISTSVTKITTIQRLWSSLFGGLSGGAVVLLELIRQTLTGK